MSDEDEWGLTSEEEWKALEIKHQYAKTMFSVILEGPAVGYIKGRKKKAGQSGSRGKYLSHCVVFYDI